MTPNDDAVDPAVTQLEEMATEVMQRLHPDARQAAINVKLAALKAKFTQEYGTDPPASMIDAVSKATDAELEQAVRGDLNGLKVTVETVTAALAADMKKAEELPTALSDAAAEHKRELTFDQRSQVTQTEELKTLNLRADLHGAGFARVRAAYQQAAASDDRSTLRFLERQRALGWPGVARDRAELDAELGLEQLVKQTRASRVSPSLRAAHARASKIWSANFDAAHRLFRDGKLRSVK